MTNETASVKEWSPESAQKVIHWGGLTGRKEQKEAFSNRFRGKSKDHKYSGSNRGAMNIKGNRLPENPFLGSVFHTLFRDWPKRDFGVLCELCHTGASFKALDALIFRAPSLSPCI